MRELMSRTRAEWSTPWIGDVACVRDVLLHDIQHGHVGPWVLIMILPEKGHIGHVSLSTHTVLQSHTGADLLVKACDTVGVTICM